MKIVFFGTSRFACPCITALHSQYEIPFVVTSTSDSPVKKKAQELNIKVHQSESPDDILETLKQTKPDVICVSAYGHILKKSILDIPKYAIGIHPSLLPKYRGAAPINWVLINGEKQTGVTTFIMNEKIDAGNILLEKSLNIYENETKGELETRLGQLGAELILSTINGLLKNKIIPKPQNKKQGSYAPKLTKEIRKINWNKGSKEIVNLIRGLSPTPAAYTTFRNKRIEILKALPCDTGGAPSEIIPNKKELIVSCGRGSVIIQELKPEGKKLISGKDFINGYRPKNGENFC